ncbi:MAG: TnsA-like heteromeric transposase endonuclease subunit [Pseudonocardiales bacterium]|nr:TnsA-like heteromeric transposase endonuclease subunit [Pseudonocardiales bacterium]MBV9730057.1 TnsA-like heteromeric transposase endonuclease subunit [Pseudonocardiales bacterium]
MVLASIGSAAQYERVAGVELAFVDGRGVEQRRSFVECWDTRFEDGRPVREFRWSKGQRHNPGWWWTATMGGHVGYESWLERDVLMMLDFDPEVVAVVSQPFWLYWDEDCRHRRHCPDYFVRRSDGTAMVVDVRADDRIEPNDAEAFAAMEEACAQAGWRFRRLGVADAVVTANVRWLSRYRHPRCAGADGLAESLVAAFDQPTSLWGGAAAVGDRLAVLPVLFHLLWRHELATDLTTRLGPSTLVYRGRKGRGR